MIQTQKWRLVRINRDGYKNKYPPEYVSYICARFWVATLSLRTLFCVRKNAPNMCKKCYVSVFDDLTAYSIQQQDAAIWSPVRAWFARKMSVATK